MNIVVLASGTAGVIIVVILFVIIFNVVDNHCKKMCALDETLWSRTNDAPGSIIASAPACSEDDTGAMTFTSQRTPSDASFVNTKSESHVKKTRVVDDDGLPTYEEVMSIQRSSLCSLTMAYDKSTV